MALSAERDQAMDQLAYSNLRSPFDGIVVATYVEPHEYVRAKQPILRLLNAQKVEMVVEVPETMITHVPFVKRIAVEIDVLKGQEFVAKIKEVGTEASMTTRTFPVTLELDQPKEGAILAGMAGHAIFFVEGTLLPDEVFLPTTAVFSREDKNQSFVWVVNPETMTIEQREVVIGRLSDRGLYIKSGLESNEWVVTSGVNLLSNGQKVRLQQMALDEEGEIVEIKG
jgi:RND family efflux transporter MFP subunit